MDDFLHHLLVVAAFFAAALPVKIGVALAGSALALDTPSVVFPVLFGLAAALLAHRRARRLRPVAGPAAPRS